MNKILLIISISLFLLGCSTTGEGYMQQSELLAQINQGKAPIIVDVRSDAEYKAGHVPGAIHVPFWTAFTTDKMDEYNKSDAVVMYCAHGPRAGVAKLAFYFAGFEKLSYLAGHMTAWTKAGLPVE
jgi:hydroxyacylglutathione hydrolase